MQIIPLGSPEAAGLADRLAALKTFLDIPRAEVEWLRSHGEFRQYDTGEVVLTPADEATEMIVIVSGCATVYVGQGGGRRHAVHSRTGSLTGVLPFSRLKHPFTDVLVEEPTDLLAIHRDLFPAMIRECPALTESLVHNMVDRARRFSAINWQDEKVMSLGRLAAGLAHELNNPASAASSAAKHLARAIRSVGAAAHRVGMAELSADQRALITGVVDRCQTNRSTPRSAMDRFDRIDMVVTWLDSHDASTDCAQDLVDGGVEIGLLDELASALPAGALGSAIQWIASAAASSSVASDIERATLRISDVVSAVRDFTHMDRAAVREPTDVAQSLAETVEVLRSKAREKGATVQMDVPPGLPKIIVVAADLNQAWSNLIENAIDAVDAGGEVKICASARDGVVIVEIVDNGSGIPPDIQPRIFDPFFTTKPVGKGTGLGLDIVRRVVSDYSGEVEFSSHPGHTSFRVRIPVEFVGPRPQ